MGTSLTKRLLKACFVFLAVIIPGAAFAASRSFVLPEPDPLALVVLGLAGVVIGRRLAIKKPPGN